MEFLASEWYSFNTNADFNELILSHDEEFTNDDLIQSEAFQQSEENTTMPPTLDAKKFTTKRFVEIFNLIDTSLAKLESMDSDTERENVCRHIHAGMSTYKAIFDKKACDHTIYSRHVAKMLFTTTL
ncbi:hypothetical protein QE152_g39859 [Popillia japonica]|uniref:Uncharacterized protein n=1 Tax=Popillia japonica TaxID=7064 RepID=A0AAW1HSN2_POPJA